MASTGRALVALLMAVMGGVEAGFPSVTPTVGSVWPRPLAWETRDTYYVIRPDAFKFVPSTGSCTILTEALKRYESTMFNNTRGNKMSTGEEWEVKNEFRGYLDAVKVDISICEDHPHENMDESYVIELSPSYIGNGTIAANTVWGVLRGLESFSQLLVPAGSSFTINVTAIADEPRFSYRGLMLDTARHFLPVSKLKENLDLMAMNKLNVFHWHLVDDQSFPYESVAFPDLSKLGAYSSSHVYSAADVADIVEYARLRGIRVLPEFDTPGHTQSWGPGQPGLLTTCYTNSTPDGTFGPIDPANDANYDFLKSFFTEVTQRFPDHYVHLGGDEVDFSCWKSNPNITQFMAQHNITGDYSKLEEVYVKKLLDIVANLPTKNGYFVWQEVFDNGVDIAKDTVVHVWKNENVPAAWKKELDQVTGAGYQTVLSSCWYLNYISYGVDWHKYYECDPQEFNGTTAQQQLVLGGEACMWGEYVDRTNLISRTWPRAAVVAEKLWSATEHTADTAAATPRLEEHRCRLLARGFDVEPLWPSFCPDDL
nr:beta-hexosaminidase subunit alpha-like [Penaeus vannamei]